MRGGLRRRVRRVITVVVLVMASVIFPMPAANAGVGLAVVPSFDPNQQVGNMTTAIVTVTNASNNLGGSNNADDSLALGPIVINPSCDTPSTPCPAPNPDVGVAVITGARGLSGTCPVGTTFTITGPDAAGNYTLTPVPPVVLGPATPPPPPPPPASPVCQFEVDFNVLRRPADGSSFFTVAASATSLDPTSPGAGTGSGTQFYTVAAVTPRLSTVAAQTGPSGTGNLGTTTDTASLLAPTGAAPGIAPPGGTITFTLTGPNDPTCAAVASPPQTVPVAGFGNYTNPTPVPITAAGTYRWVASYSGDPVNGYNAIANVGCNDPAEAVTFAAAQPQITTTAQPAAPIGTPITDTATISGLFIPPGTPAGTTQGDIVFTLFNNPNCTGAPIFTSTVPVTNGNGSYTSGPFTPTAPGTYNWIASFVPANANNTAVATACGDPGEVTTVAPNAPQITTVATAAAPIGTPITDTATISGLFIPPGTPAGTTQGDIVFTLFNNPNCTGAPIFKSTVAVTNGNGSYTSGPFTPTAAGTYNWVASFVPANANNTAVATACGDPGEVTTVAPNTPQIVTLATGTGAVGEPISDTATISGLFIPPGTPAGTSQGDIVFTLFGPDDPTCTAAPIFTSTVPVTNGNGTYTSGSFTANGPGSYRWIARFVPANTNNTAVQTNCNDPGEITPVQRAAPNITTSATPTVTFNGPNTTPVTDTATVVGYFTPPPPTPAPTPGNLIFRVFGPDNPNCFGPGIVVPPPVPVTANGDYTSGPFVPGAPGTYQWVVEYTGDAFNGPMTTACGAAGETTVVAVTPTIQVLKSADPLTRPEPGGAFTYTVVVTNTSVQPLTITSLNDNVYGNLATRPGSTCGALIGTTLAPGASSPPCTFTGTFTGNAGDSLTDVVTVVGTNPQGVQVTDTDDATVSLTDVLPTVTIVKTADPLSRPEPGGDFTYTVVVTNTSNEPVTITSLTDNVYGNLATRGTCTTAIGTNLAAAPGPGNTYTCTFTAPFTGTAGQSLNDVATVVVVDNDNDTATASDDATVTLTNVGPTVDVQKTADPLSRPEPGGPFTFSVVVTNTSNEPVTITSLTDNIYGNIAQQGTCTTAIGTVLQPGGTYSCQFTGNFTGVGGASQTDTVRVTVVDRQGSTAEDTDNATVTLTNVLPTVDVQKTANPLSLPEPGGTFTFTVVVTNTSNEPVTITSLVDDVYGNLNGRGTCAIGAVLQPAGTYTCSFQGQFIGVAPQSQTDTVTATVVDRQGSTATDTDTATVTLTNVAPTVAVTKTATPTSRPEPGGTFDFTVVVTNTSNEPVTITSLTDDVFGNLNGRGTCAIGAVLAPAPGPGNTYTCTFQGSFFADAGARQTDTVTVVVVDRQGSTASAQARATVEITNVPPTILVTKLASPGSMLAPGGTFTFTVSVTNTSNEPVQITSLTDDVFGDLNGRGTCAIGAILPPGGTYTCSFQGDFFGNAGATQTDTVTAVAVDNEGSQAVAQARAQVRLEQPVTPVVQPPPPPLPPLPPLPPGVTPPPPPIPPPPSPPIAFTGSDVDRSARLATGMVLLGLLLVGAGWRSGNLNLAWVLAGPFGPSGLYGPGGPGRRRRHGNGGEPPAAGPMAFWGGPPSGPTPSGRPGSTALLPPAAPPDTIFRPGPGVGLGRPAPRRGQPPAPPTGSGANVSVLASGFGLAAGKPRPARPVSRGRAGGASARAALVTLGLHLPDHRHR